MASEGRIQTLRQAYYLKGSAMCVQGFDDSRNSAIHITYRSSLRPSSLRLPRHPWFAIVLGFDISRSCSRAGLLGRRKLTCNRYQVALWFILKVL